ncbi:MAG TPA: peptide deformylase [Candidatus Paceibacterota bacterium]|nr:peptide deformylase [Candidatus Paceibacterota bacterium]
MKPIVQNGDPVLREKAAPVEDRLFGTKELQDMVDAMAVALDAEPDGVAIAAPQIGLGKRIFLVRHDRLLPPPAEGTPPYPVELGVFINPEITKTSRRMVEMDEGCLSVRGTYGRTMRHERASVRARDVDGNVFERGGGGVLAQAFQHEIDHLDGILFIDHAHDFYEHVHSPIDE